MPTFTNVKQGLAALGVSIKFDRDYREYRVNYHGGREETAYYTDDLEDAYLTGVRMSQEIQGAQCA